MYKKLFKVLNFIEPILVIIIGICWSLMIIIYLSNVSLLSNEKLKINDKYENAIFLISQSLVFGFGLIIVIIEIFLFLLLNIKTKVLYIIYLLYECVVLFTILHALIIPFVSLGVLLVLNIPKCIYRYDKVDSIFSKIFNDNIEIQEK